MAKEINLTFKRDRSIVADTAAVEFLSELTDFAVHGEELVTWRDSGGYYELAQDVSADKIAYMAAAGGLNVAFEDNADPNFDGEVIVKVTQRDGDHEPYMELVNASHPDGRDFKDDWDGVKVQIDEYQVADIYTAMERLGWEIGSMSHTVEVDC